jgi:thioredoxin reductase (NADPH)
VFVIGGGNAAGQAAMHFAQAACHVTMVIRGSSLKSTLSQYLIDRIATTPNIDVLTQTEVTALDGDEVLREIRLTQRTTDESRTEAAKWLFVCIGGEPQTEWASEVGIVRDAGGYLVTGPDLVRNGACPAHWPLSREPYYLETSMPVVRGRRCAPRLDQALRLSGGRGRDGGGACPSLPGKWMSPQRHASSKRRACAVAAGGFNGTRMYTS